MKSNIILEGPDGSGKSTLALRLADQLDRKVVHSGGPEKYPGEIRSRLYRFGKMEGRLIFDRHPIFSQSIHSFLTPGSTQISFADRSSFYLEMKRKEWDLVFCMGDGPNRKSSFETEKYYHKVEEKRSFIQEAYWRWFMEEHMLFPRVILYDFNYHTTEDVMKVLSSKEC